MSSSDSEPRPAPAYVSTVFERLAADSGPDGVWGFAAEAQKQKRLEPEPQNHVRVEVELQRPKRIEAGSPRQRRSEVEPRKQKRFEVELQKQKRLEVELIKQRRLEVEPQKNKRLEAEPLLSIVDTESVQSRLEPESPRPEPERHRVARRRSRCGERLLTTLFDGLSEFYSVRSASRSASRARARSRAASPAGAGAGAEPAVLKETRSTFRKYQAALLGARSRSRSASPAPGPRLSASQLVRSLAAGKHRAGPAEAHKLIRGLRQAARPATNQTGKIGS